MIGRIVRAMLAAVLAAPYRLRLGAIGQRPRMFAPILLSGARRIRLGDDVRIESFASLSAAVGGSLIIGSNCEVRSFARIEADTGTLEIGDGSSVNPFCLLNGYGGLRIGRDVRIASHTVILSSSHEHASSALPIAEQGIAVRGTHIGDDVWIGAHAVIVGGVTIGAHTVIGAGAVVLTDIPAYSVAAGVPARVIRMRNG